MASIFKNIKPANVNKRSHPFGHVFPYLEKWYFFDVGSNMLLEVDPVLAAVLPVYGLAADDVIIQELSSNHDRKAVQLAIDEIASAQAEGLTFQSRRPKIATTATGCYNPEGYENNLEQLTLTLSEQCNLRCQYCLHSSSEDWIRPHGNQSMSLETARKSLLFFGQRCRRDGHPTVSFYGGEPLLEFGIIKNLVQIARLQTDWPEIKFIIDTNGTLITDEIADFICTEKIHLQISVDGSPEAHDRYRKTKAHAPTYDGIMHGLEKVLTRDPEAARRMSFIATVTPPFDFLGVAKSFHPLPLFERFGMSITPPVLMNVVSLKGLDSTLFGDPSTFQTLLSDNLSRMREVYVEHHRLGQRDRLNPVIKAYYDKELIRFFHRKRAPFKDRICPTGYCQPGQRRLHVKADGTFQPCERVGENFPIGNIGSGFSLPAVQQLLEDQFKAVAHRCEDCWAVRMCGLCFTSLNQQFEGKPAESNQIPEEFCQQVRRNELEMLQLYLDLKSCGPDATDFLQDTELR